MKNKTINLLHIVNKLSSLFTSFGLQQCKSDLDLTITVVKLCKKWYTCEGIPGLKRFKQFSVCFNRSVMGTCNHLPFSSKNKRLLSKCLYRAQVSDLSRVYWITVFNCHRLIFTDTINDTTTITSGFKGSLWRVLIKLEYLYKATKSFKSTYVETSWSAKWKWHISGASGPNGSVAYTRLVEDFQAIKKEGLWWKISLLYLSLPLCNKWENFRSLADAFVQSIQISSKGVRALVHSRLTFLSDKSGKTRVIGIVDLLSQSTLKVVHQRCNRILRRLPTDGTFDQDKQRERVRLETMSSHSLSSIDLSAATDRIPVFYQTLVLIWCGILTPFQALGWFLVITRRSFLVNTKEGPKFIRYKVGQPMGALSSWPVMAISHHVLVWWSYKMTYPWKNPRFFTGYSILGDDLVIFDKEVAKNYLELISILGIDYSPDKSYFSVGLAEFAKSLFLRGRDLTPFPLGALKFEKNSFSSNLQVILSECSRRNLRTTLSTILGISPKRWRELALLTALSPLYDKSVLDVPRRKDFHIFRSLLLINRIKYFSRLSTVRKSIHAFIINNPSLSVRLDSSPFQQIALDNSERYPVRHIVDIKQLISPIPLLGDGWISWCSICWPDGLPSVTDESLVPGPTWSKENDDFMVRSSLIKLNKILPGYFTVRCVGSQVGELRCLTGGENPVGS